MLLISKLTLRLGVALLSMLALVDAAAEDKPTIGLAAIDLQTSFFVRMKKAADVAAKDYGVNTSWQSAEGSLEKQVAIIENFINQKVAVILVDSLDKNALIRVIKKAEAAGIPVITMGNKVDAGSNYSTLYPDYENMSAVAKAVGTRMGGAGNLGLLVGSRGNYVSDTREKGFVDTIKRDFPNIKIVGVEPTNWDPVHAANAAQTWLATYPDLKAIACISDSLCLAAHAVATAMENNLLYGGIDGDVETRPMVDSGEMVVDVLTDGYRVGYWNIAVAARLAKGHKLPRDLYLPTYLVSSATTAKALSDAGLTIDSITSQEADVESHNFAEQFGPSQPDSAMTIGKQGDL